MGQGNSKDSKGADEAPVETVHDTPPREYTQSERESPAAKDQTSPNKATTPAKDTYEIITSVGDKGTPHKQSNDHSGKPKASMCAATLSVRVGLAGYGIKGKGSHEFTSDEQISVPALPTTEAELRALLQKQYGLEPDQQDLLFYEDASRNASYWSKFDAQHPLRIINMNSKLSQRWKIKANLSDTAGEQKQISMWVTQYTTAAQFRDQLLQGIPKRHARRAPPDPLVPVDAVIYVGTEMVADNERLYDKGLRSGGVITVRASSHALPKKTALNQTNIS